MEINKLLERIYSYLAPSNIAQAIYKSPAQMMREGADELEQKEIDIVAFREFIENYRKSQNYIIAEFNEKIKDAHLAGQSQEQARIEKEVEKMKRNADENGKDINVFLQQSVGYNMAVEDVLSIIRNK